MTLQASLKSESQPPSYLILGAGVFGASTALHLIQKHPNASITLVDRGIGAYEAAASWDWQKVVRAEYEDYFYMSMALEALDEWRSNDLFKPFFHQSGAVWMMRNPDYVQTIAENYKKSGRQVSYEIIDPAELRKRYDGMFAGADLEGVGEIFDSPTSGWASAKEALSAAIAEAVKLGVNNVALDVAKLEFDDAGGCIGIIGKNGVKLAADKILVTSGTFTATLLADSAPDRKDLQVDDRFVSTGVSTALLQLDEERQEKFKNAPVFVHNVAETMGKGSIQSQSSGPVADIKYRGIPACPRRLHKVQQQHDIQEYNLPCRTRTEHHRATVW